MAAPDARVKPAIPVKGARRRVILAACLFVFFMGLFYALVHNPYVGPEPFHPYLAFVAKTVARIVNLFGHEASVFNTVVESSQFSMRIVRGCDAIEPTAAFVAAVLASPVAFWTKFPGVLLGAAALGVVNIVRLVTLFFVGVYARGALDFMHEDMWQAAFIVLAICFWAIWVQWAVRHKAFNLTFAETRRIERRGK